MSLYVSADEQAETEQRRRFLDHLVELNGGPVRCARRIEGTSVDGAKGYGDYPTELSVEAVHYRCVIPAQTVFDIGDHSPWPETARQATVVMETLDGLDIDYLPALSGGTGFHVEVFSTPSLQPSDWRKPFMSHILTVAAGRLGADSLDVDPLLKAPGRGSRLVRDFGQRKHSLSSRRKRLWPKSESLPDDRDEAYRVAERGPAIPEGVPINEGLSSRYGFLPPGCPKKPSCVRSGFFACGDCSGLRLACLHDRLRLGFEATMAGKARAAHAALMKGVQNLPDQSVLPLEAEWRPLLQMVVAPPAKQVARPEFSAGSAPSVQDVSSGGNPDHATRFKALMALLRSGSSDDEIHAVFSKTSNYDRAVTQYHVDHARRTYL